ncbi:MAG: shikimate kinase [Lachnospiraceae bacterium]
MEKQNIFLIGFMGTGKSTIAAELSRRLGMERMEMDTAIAEEQGMSINDIFKEYGEAYFRDLESKLLTELQKKKGMVVSCGGGTVLRSENVQYMKKSGMIVLLGASPETIYRRVRNSNDRPILNHNMTVEYISELMEKRRGSYESAADIMIETDEKTPSQICDEIIQKGIGR